MLTRISTDVAGEIKPGIGVRSVMPSPDVATRGGPTDISVVMATWNNATRLAITLDELSRCRVPPGVRWELILVDNNCSDETPLAAQRWANHLRLVYRHERRQGLSHARNAGIAAAAGALIVFADDDITPCPRWLETYWRAYRERPVGFFFGGRLVPAFESAPLPPELLPFASLPLTGLDWGREPRALAADERFLGANWACPAAALRRAGAAPICGRR
jgi:glycosyltransferase involved in cell wall biosynthesis